MKKPKFLVVLPSYNGEKFLSQQIDSILNQKDVDLRVIVRDDFSTDGTKEILQKFESRVNIEYGDHNLGTYLSLRRMLVNHKESEYLAFADQDDVWESNHLIAAYKILSKSSAAKPALYFPQYRYINSFGSQIGIRPPRKHVGISNALVENPAIGCGVVINSMAVDLLKTLSPCKLLHMDQQAYFCTALTGEVHQGVQVTVNYRIHSNNQVGVQNGMIRHLANSMKSHRLRDSRSELERLYLQLESQLKPGLQRDMERHFKSSRRNLLTRGIYATRPVFRREKPIDQLIFRFLSLVNWA